MTAAIERALTMADLRRRWATSPARIREMIRAGTLVAIDLGSGTGRTALRFTAASVAAAEAAMAVRAAPKAAAKRPKVSDEVRQALGGGR
jgi:predicted RNA methylase